MESAGVSRQTKVALVTALAFAVIGISACVERERLEPLSEDYLLGIEQWKSERDESLRRDDGWLTLVGLWWLEEGVNRLGSDPSSDVIFPAALPESFGEIVVASGAVRIELDADIGIEHDGRTVTSVVMQTDATGEPTILRKGSVSFYVIERAGRLAVRIKDSNAAALEMFTGMDYYPVTPEWRLVAKFEPFDPPTTMKLPNVVGTASEETVPGIISFTHAEQKYELTPVAEPGEPLFIVFGDQTNGEETYGGGRFLIIEAPSEDGTVVLDFNRAYNPPCVFTPYATCPLPPPRNKLSIAIEAGELSFGSHH